MNQTADSRPSGGVSMTLLLLIGLVLFLLWATLFEIDQTVRATGQVIPAARTQIIQTADGGVVAEILAQEGQRVAAGERLAVLERIRPTAAYEESRSRGVALSAALVRALAEAGGHSPVYAKDLQQFPDIVDAQQALYAQRLRSLQQEVASLNDALVLAREELRISESLLKTGDISRLEVMRAERQVGELQGRINAVRNKYLQDARQEATKLAEELMSSRYKLEEQKNILDHTVLAAPVAGVVKYLKVTTIGGVLRPGDELMQISPTDGGVFIEVRVNPVDIGPLKTGLPATVKLDAFDYSTYGTLHGVLNYLSSDTLSEQGSTGQVSTYYRAQIKLDPVPPHSKLASVTIKPGMTATVDIRTDSRSVLRYLAKPVVKAFSGAMNER